MDLKEIGCDGDQWRRSLGETVMNFLVPWKTWNFLTSCVTISLWSNHIICDAPRSWSLSLTHTHTHTLSLSLCHSPPPTSSANHFVGISKLTSARGKLCLYIRVTWYLGKTSQPSRSASTLLQFWFCDNLSCRIPKHFCWIVHKCYGTRVSMSASYYSWTNYCIVLHCIALHCLFVCCSRIRPCLFLFVVHGLGPVCLFVCLFLCLLFTD
jgi:hypothetical protein